MKQSKLVKALVWGSLLAPSILLAAGCTWLGLACTQVACYDEATVTIVGLTTDQLYKIELETEDGVVGCAMTPGAAQGITCNGSIFYGREQDEAWISIEGTPERIAVTVWQGDVVIHQEETEPDYDKNAPNGEACGPVCLSGDAIVEL